jgi:hypothetical protein
MPACRVSLVATNGARGSDGHSSGRSAWQCCSITAHSGQFRTRAASLLLPESPNLKMAAPLFINEAIWVTTFQLNIADVIGHCRWEHTCIHSGHGRSGQMADGALCWPNNRRRTVLLLPCKHSARAECGRRVTSLAFVRSLAPVMSGQFATGSFASRANIRKSQQVHLNTRIHPNR